jgi:hypothetical protein
MLSATELLSTAKAAGLSLSVEGERLIVRGARALENLARQVLSRKAEILPLLRPNAPAELAAVDERIEVLDLPGRAGMADWSRAWRWRGEGRLFAAGKVPVGSRPPGSG